eukprot:1548659-Amphidinium_carterae.2
MMRKRMRAILPSGCDDPRDKTINNTSRRKFRLMKIDQDLPNAKRHPKLRLNFGSQGQIQSTVELKLEQFRTHLTRRLRHVARMLRVSHKAKKCQRQTILLTPGAALSVGHLQAPLDCSPIPWSRIRKESVFTSATHNAYWTDYGSILEQC